MIAVEDISKSFDGKQVLSNVSLQARQGELVALIGPSGAGKSTLLRCINCLETIDSGRITANGTVITADSQLGAAALANLRRQVGMVFQGLNLWPYRTAFANIVEGLVHSKQMPKAQAADRAREWGTRLGIEEHLQKYPSQLSGGQRQRVAIARAVAMEPSFLLLDEITAALDPILAGQLADILVELRQTGLGMIIVTHQVDFIRRSADKVCFIQRGAVCESGTRDILDNPLTEELQKFLRAVRHGW